MGEANGLAVAIPLTSNPRRLSFEYTLLIEPDRRNRLSAPSVAMVFQIVSLDDRFFIYRIGVPSEEEMAAIAEMLGELLGLGRPVDNPT